MKKVALVACVALILVMVSAVIAIPAVASAYQTGTCTSPPSTGSILSPINTITLTGTIRDFNNSHPDFGKVPVGDFHVQTGLVQNTLDADGKPVFSGVGGPQGAIYSQDTFAQWYRDVQDVNSRIDYPLTLTETSPGSGIYTFSPGVDGSFFPVDDFTTSVGYQLDTGWDGNLHNFLFTMELRGNITYKAGTSQTFIFNSDDDLWVFVNGQLVVDLGGVHPWWNPDDTKQVNLDDVAGSLGLTNGQTYDLAMFFAERHTLHSQFIVSGPVAPVPEASTIILLSLGVVALGGFVWYGTRRRKKIA